MYMYMYQEKNENINWSYIKFLEAFDELNTLVVTGPHKRLSSHVKLKLIQ